MQNDTQKILRLPAVLERIGMSKPWLYLAIKAGRFPAPIKIGPRASGWLESEIDLWVEARINARAGQ